MSPPAGLASTFECDTAAGFQWITLDASLASATEGTDPDAGKQLLGCQWAGPGLCLLCHTVLGLTGLL